MDISGETELSVYEVDQKIYRFYERLGKRVRDNREWFEVNGGVYEIKRVHINQDLVRHLQLSIT